MTTVPCFCLWTRWTVLSSDDWSGVCGGWVPLQWSSLVFFHCVWLFLMPYLIVSAADAESMG